MKNITSGPRQPAYLKSWIKMVNWVMPTALDKRIISHFSKTYLVGTH